MLRFQGMNANEYVDQQIRSVGFTAEQMASVNSAADLRAVFASVELGAPDFTNFDKGITFNKQENRIGFRSGRIRNVPNTTYYEPIFRIQNTPVPTEISVKGKYTNTNNALCYFVVSAQRLSDNAYFRAFIFSDQSAVLTIGGADGVHTNNAFSGATNMVRAMKSTEVLDFTTKLADQSNWAAFIGNETKVNINIESPIEAYSSSGNRFNTYPFYLESLRVQF